MRWANDDPPPPPPPVTANAPPCPSRSINGDMASCEAPPGLPLPPVPARCPPGCRNLGSPRPGGGCCGASPSMCIGTPRIDGIVPPPPPTSSSLSSSSKPASKGASIEGRLSPASSPANKNVVGREALASDWVVGGASWACTGTGDGARSSVSHASTKSALKGAAVSARIHMCIRQGGIICLASSVRPGGQAV